MWDDGHRGDFQVCRPQFLKVVPQKDLAESRLDLVLDVILEEGNGVRGPCSWVRAVVCDDVPLPVWTAVDRNPMSPLLHGWRKWVDLGERLRVH